MEKIYRSLEEMPMILSAGDLGAFLGLSRGKVYELLNSRDFPTLRIGKRMMVPKDKFLNWIDQNTGGLCD